MFGGTEGPLTGSDETQPELADTTLLQFSECLVVSYHIPLQYVCTSVDTFCKYQSLRQQTGSPYMTYLQLKF